MFPMHRVLLMLAATGLAILMAVSTAVAQEQGGPRLPTPSPVTVDPSATALLVLDMSTRCSAPGGNICHELAPVIADFLPRAREAGMLIIYTVSASAQGTALGETWEGFERQPDEPVVYPDSFDKFHTPEIRDILEQHGIRRVIVTGSSANQAVLFTVAGGARNWHYDFVIPLDGTISGTDYEYDYSMHALNSIQGSGGINPFAFTTFDMISFAR